MLTEISSRTLSLQSYYNNFQCGNLMLIRQIIFWDLLLHSFHFMFVYAFQFDPANSGRVYAEAKLRTDTGRRRKTHPEPLLPTARTPEGCTQPPAAPCIWRQWSWSLQQQRSAGYVIWPWPSTSSRCPPSRSAAWRTPLGPKPAWRTAPWHHPTPRIVERRTRPRVVAPAGTAAKDASQPPRATIIGVYHQPTAAEGADNNKLAICPRLFPWLFEPCMPFETVIYFICGQSESRVFLK